VEKNNCIRLTAAKRTIQQLEGSPEAVNSSNASGAKKRMDQFSHRIISDVAVSLWRT
jgi:hypothetical protein